MFGLMSGVSSPHHVRKKVRKSISCKIILYILPPTFAGLQSFTSLSVGTVKNPSKFDSNTKLRDLLLLFIPVQTITTAPGPLKACENP